METNVKNSKISIINKGKTKVFLFILMLTSIIWLLIELSKTSISTVSFGVEYKNVPTGKLIQKKSVSEIKITLKAPGFSLLKFKVINRKINLNLKNVVKNNSNYYLLPNKQITYLNTQFPVEIEVVNVLNDTIFVELGYTKSKKVPVNPSLDLKFKLGYKLINKLKIVPDSITITGFQKIVDSIQEIETSSIKIHDVYKNINMDVALKLPSKKYNLNVSADNVQIIGKVDKFTEGRFIIPVFIINEPIDVKINTFPKEIEVVYQAGLSNFNKITKNSFSIVYDYDEYKRDTLIKYLTPIIKKKSDFISSLRVYPSQIEFLIQK
ncbi:MAG: hypothetical protein COC22_01775 [Flavobacteriaceae bacterium]|nr:MAG: hypothetical protein COC22_01775 [Flavobacteriaceae bacterium]